MISTTGVLPFAGGTTKVSTDDYRAHRDPLAVARGLFLSSSPTRGKLRGARISKEIRVMRFWRDVSSEIVRPDPYSNTPVRDFAVRNFDLIVRASRCGRLA